MAAVGHNGFKRQLLVARLQQIFECGSWNPSLRATICQTNKGECSTFSLVPLSFCLSLCLVSLMLVVMMKSKELKTKISHADSLILSHPSLNLHCEVPILVSTLYCVSIFIHSQSHTHTHSLSLVLVVVMKAKELKTKIYRTHSLILSQCALSASFSLVSLSYCALSASLLTMSSANLPLEMARCCVVGARLRRLWGARVPFACGCQGPPRGRQEATPRAQAIRRQEHGH